MKPILFFGEGEYVSVDPQNLICVKADALYTKVFIKNTEASGKPFIKHTATVNVGGFAKKLPASKFCRVSRSVVVNMDSVKSIRDGAVQLHTDVEEPILIGKTYRQQFLKRFNRIQ